MSTQFAFQFSLIAFATYVLRAMVVGGDFENTLKVGILVLTLFFGIGFAVGDWARRLAEETAEREILQSLAELATDQQQSDALEPAEST